MPDYSDRWLWFVDDELVEKLMKPDEPSTGEPVRPAETKAAAKALALHTEGKSKQALETLERAIEKGEGLADLYAMAGAIRIELQQWDAAASTFCKLIEIDPAHRTAHHNLAVALARQAKFEEAAAEFEKSRAIAPQLWQSALGAGICYLETGKPEQALDAFQAALALNSSDKAQFGKAVALQQLNRLDEAQEIYRKILPENANNPEILGNLIALSSARQDHSRLREYSDRLLKLRPQSRLALEGLVAASFGRNDFKSAAQYGTQLVKVAADSAEAWFNLAVANQNLGRNDQAAKAYEKSLKAKEDPAVFADLAIVREQLGDKPGARQAYEKAVESSPQNPEPLWNLSIFHEKNGEAEEAELTLEQLVEVKPDWDAAWFRLGQMRFNRGDYGSAIEAFDNCLKLKPDWIEAIFNAGVARLRAGKEADSRTYLEQAAVAGIPEALKALAAVTAADGDVIPATKYYRAAVAAGISAPELSFNVGLAVQKAGDLESASEFYADALQQKPEFTEALINLGHALNDLGRAEDAQACWQRVREFEGAPA